MPTRKPVRRTARRDGDAATADEYFAAVAEPLRGVALAARAVVREALPEAAEQLKWNQPWYELDGRPVGYIAVHSHWVNLGFARGSELDDPLLEGTGKGLRHVKLRPGGELPIRTLERLLLAAAKLPRSSEGDHKSR